MYADLGDIFRCSLQTTSKTGIAQVLCPTCGGIAGKSMGLK